MSGAVLPFPKRKRSRRWVPTISEHDGADDCLRHALYHLERADYRRAAIAARVALNCLNLCARMMGDDGEQS